MKRIAFAVQHLSTGGMPRFVLNSIRYLNREKYQPFLFEEKYCGINEIRDQILGIDDLTHHHCTPQEFLAFIRDYDIDLIHYHDWNIEARPKDIPSIATIHNACIEEARYRQTGHADFPIGHADIHLLISDHQIPFFERENYHRVNTFIDENEFNPEKFQKEALRQKYGFAANDKIIIYVAILAPGKNHAELLKLWNNHKMHDSTKLLFAGPLADNFKDYWQPLVDEYESSNIQFLGARTDIPELLAISDVAINFSKYEGCCLANLEAASMGLPLVVSDIPSNRYVFQDNETAIIRPLDETFIKGAHMLLENPQLAHAVGNRAHQMVLSDYSTTKYTETIEDIYDSILGTRHLSLQIPSGRCSGRREVSPSVDLPPEAVSDNITKWPVERYRVSSVMPVSYPPALIPREDADVKGKFDTATPAEGITPAVFTVKFNSEGVLLEIPPERPTHEYRFKVFKEETRYRQTGHDGAYYCTYDTTIESKSDTGVWARGNGHFWYTEYKYEVYRDGELIEAETFNLTGEDVIINIDTNALGDTIAWMPYILEFKEKHQCNLTVRTGHPQFLEKLCPDITFVTDIPNQNWYMGYHLGVYVEPTPGERHKVHWRYVRLQEVATDMLGLEYKEKRLDLTPLASEKSIEGKYVCIAPRSTMRCKEWNYELDKGKQAWQTVVDWLVSQNYKVVWISREECFLNNVIDKSGDLPLEDRITDLAHADFFIGLPAGLSWLAYGCNCHVFMITGFSYDWCEFQHNVTRISRNDVCRGCFNEHYEWTRDWNWCPTGKQFQCTRYIEPQQVLEAMFFRSNSPDGYSSEPVLSTETLEPAKEEALWRC